MKQFNEFWPVVGAAALRAAPYVAKAVTRMGPSTAATAPSTAASVATAVKNKYDAYRAKKKKQQNEDVPTMSTSAIPDPKTTVQGPSQLFKPRTVTDRRYKKRAVMIKPFRQYIKDKHDNS